MKEYHKKWYRENKEQSKVKAAEWRRKNAKRFKETKSKHYVANKDRIQESNRQWRLANADRYRRGVLKYKLKTRYGMTPEDKERMFEAQGCVCKCCGSPDPKAKNWHVDHCHETNVVRGILCHPCNIMLGCAADDPLTLLKGVEYLLLV